MALITVMSKDNIIFHRSTKSKSNKVAKKIFAMNVEIDGWFRHFHIGGKNRYNPKVFDIKTFLFEFFFFNNSPLIKLSFFKALNRLLFSILFQCFRLPSHYFIFNPLQSLALVWFSLILSTFTIDSKGNSGSLSVYTKFLSWGLTMHHANDSELI